MRNVYTGALVRALANVGVGPLQLSGDGNVLYVGDETTKRIIAVDSTTGAAVRSYQDVLTELSAISAEQMATGEFRRNSSVARVQAMGAGKAAKSAILATVWHGT